MVFITGTLLYDFFVLATAITVIFILYCKWCFQYWKNRDVPYFKPSIPWGNIRAPHRRIVSIGEEITEMYMNAKEKGYKYLGFYSITSPTFLPLDLDIIKNILTKDFSHFVDRGVYYNEKDEPITGHLFAIGGQKWRNLRTKFTPTFTSGKMRHMFETIADSGSRLNEFLVKELPHHEPIEIKNVLANFTTDVIGSCAFGLEINSFKDPNNPFRTNGNKIFNRTKLESLKFSIAMNFPNLARFLRICVSNPEVSNFFTKVVEDTIQYRKKNATNRQDFLQLLIDIQNDEQIQKPGDGSKLTLGEIVAQSFVFFAAGFETSSTTMTYALFELAKNQDVQDKVRQEIREVLKKHGGKITYDALHEMTYMSQVIDETLRLYPPVPLITRKCIQDYVIPDTNVKISKGELIFIPIKGIQYDEDYYENPYEFDPERFSEENKRNRNQYSYMPFGEGPRMCIGMRFGILQTKVGLVNILKDFRVNLNKKTKLPLKFMVSSLVPQVEGGIWLDLERI